RWLSDFCSVDRKRLIGGAWIHLFDVDEAVRDVREAVEKLNLRVIAFRPNRYAQRNWFDPAYDRLWATIQDLDVPIAFHEGGGGALVETAGAPRFQPNHVLWHIVSHPFEQMLACMSLIMGGVLERFPKLRVAFLESGCGWAPFWLDRMNEHWERHIQALGP